MLIQIAPGLHMSQGTKGYTNIIAAFDLDWTLIRNIYGRFPKSSDDWAFLPNRIELLRLYRDLGYTLVIFTNQGYKGQKLTTAINRINNVALALASEGIYPFIYAATGESIYRKPNTSMWEIFIQHIELSPDKWDKEKSFYVGDAAGRPEDHSSDDILFAYTAGIKFNVPEEIFIGPAILIPETQTMFIFVGMPGSGKTTYYETYLRNKGWIHANQDTLKTRAKLLSTIENSLAVGQSVAVDGTNPSPEKISDYIKLAIKYKVPTMIIYFVGNGYGRNKLRQNPVPDIAYNMYFKNLTEPTMQLHGVPVVQLT